MRIALTGGTGFIGSHFLDQALAAGHDVLAIRRSPQSRPRIPLTIQPKWLDAPLDQVAVKHLCECDVLVHLAAHSVQHPYDSLINCLRWNLLAVLGLFEQARKAGINRFIVAGSFFEYGRSCERYDMIPTDAPLEPTNSYAASKAAASIALSQWAEEHQIRLEILRVFHVYGEGEPDTRFWPSLRRAALGGEDFPMTRGQQVRDFLEVGAVARTFLNRAESSEPDQTTVTVINLSSGRACSLREFAEYWWDFWGAQGKLLLGAISYREGEIMHSQAGPSMISVVD